MKEFKIELEQWLDCLFIYVFIPIMFYLFVVKNDFQDERTQEIENKISQIEDIKQDINKLQETLNQCVIFIPQNETNQEYVPFLPINKENNE